ncbi:MAG: DNA (cytosine-5-)-methyltransferase, partial [Muribaculaceae bacterium]|nr:DNA (cytosine-5-)-methyltransferase [Muribaculaceae bacterium]
VPTHEVLCGGFPCQAFSKAGKQAGVNDTRGTLFFEIERLLRYHTPQFILLENVRNLVSHDNGRTWEIITGVLKNIGYRLTAAPLILSPHQFGVPQLRERVYIVGKYEPDNVAKPLDISFSNLKDKNDLSIYDVLEKEPVSEDCRISNEELKVLTAWDEFYQGINLKVIGFPVNTAYFHYSDDISALPEWKQSHITRNQKLYRENKVFIDKWLKKWNYLEDFTPTHRKFEWQCGTKVKSVFEGLIQMRPSGVRVKVPTTIPALVAMVQIPIIGKYRRRLTTRECARLQSFPDSFKLCSNKFQALKQFGNSVNVNVLQAIFQQLVEKYGPIEQQAEKKTCVRRYSAKPEAIQLTLFEAGALYLTKKDRKMLVGTCRQNTKSWIKQNLMYNYPLDENTLVEHPELKQVTRVLVKYRSQTVGCYKVTEVSIVAKKDLAEMGYPIKSSHHKANTKYILYKLEDSINEIPDIKTDDCDCILGKGSWDKL